MSGNGRVVQVRGEYLPVIALHEIFNLKPNVTSVHEGIMGDGKVALILDTAALVMASQQEMV